MKRLCCLALLLAAAAPVKAALADIIEQVLVKVNGEIITKTDLEQRQVQYLRQRNQQFSAEDLQNDAELKRVLAEITPQIIVDAIDELLLVQRGKELGYKLSDEDFRRIIENIKKENKIETEEQFDAALKQEGMTMTDLRKALERQMLIQRVQQVEVLGRLGVSEDEARKYYDTHPQDFTTPSAVTLKEILVEVPAAKPPQGQPAGQQMLNVALDEEAKQKAEAARARLVAGEDFAKVAGEVSDAPSKANGGLIGPVDRSQLAPALQQVIEKLKVGEVGPVIRTTRGYQLLKLEAATEAVLQPFDQARDQIADRVFNEKRRGELEKYVKKLRDQAIIEWKNAELKKLYDQRVGTTQSPSEPPR